MFGGGWMHSGHLASSNDTRKTSTWDLSSAVAPCFWVVLWDQGNRGTSRNGSVWSVIGKVPTLDHIDTDILTAGDNLYLLMPKQGPHLRLAVLCTVWVCSQGNVSQGMIWTWAREMRCLTEIQWESSSFGYTIERIMWSQIWLSITSFLWWYKDFWKEFPWF